MSIHALLGKPGAGKSYHAVQQIFDALQAGRAVVTNLPVSKDFEYFAEQISKENLICLPSSKTVTADNTDHFGHIDGWARFIDDDKAIKLQRELDAGTDESSTIGPLIIVDETAYTFNAMIGGKRKGDLAGQFEKLQEFFKVHRHALTDITLCYHDHTQADGETKALIERWHSVVNTSEMTGRNTYVVKTSAKGYTTGNVYLEKHSGTFKKSVFEMYDSYSEGAGKKSKGKKKETGLMRSKPIWRRWWFIILVLMVLSMPFLIYKTSRGIKGVVTPDKNSQGFGSTVIDNISASGTTTNQEIIPPIESGETWEPDASPLALVLGFPQPNVPFIGYDGENIYFASGQILNRDTDLSLNDIRPLVVKPCSISLLGGIGELEEIINYRCLKGF